MTTPRPRIVLLQGAFDILNYGHIRAFRYAKAQGDYLIVALNTNELIRDYKGREPVMPWSHKRSIIEACRYVDKVVPAREFSPLKLLKRYQVDVYVLTYEWEHTKAVEIAYMKQKGGRVCFSPRFRGVSSSAIKATLLKEHLDAQSAISAGIVKALEHRSPQRSGTTPNQLITVVANDELLRHRAHG